MNTLRLKSITSDGIDFIGLDEEGQAWRFIEDSHRYPEHWERLSMDRAPREKPTWPEVQARIKEAEQDAIKRQEFLTKKQMKELEEQRERERRGKLTWAEAIVEWWKRETRDN